jgi:internalin A
VGQLLTGFARSDLPLQQVLDEVRIYERENAAALGDLRAAVGRVEGLAAETAGLIRVVLKAISQEVTDCPRLFTLVPVARERWRRANFWTQPYSITLWCEHPGGEHEWGGATYTIKQVKDWLPPVLRYAQLVAKTLHVVLPIAGAVIDLKLPAEESERIKKEIELMSSVLEAFPESGGGSEGLLVSGSGGLTRAEGAGLRAFRQWLLERDSARSFGDLSRQLTPEGEYVWICPKHYEAYDPGLPTIADSNSEA